MSLEEILRLHFQVIEDFGGSHGIRDEGRLKSVVQALKQIAFGQEQYPSLYEKAAVYLRNIIGDHSFTDGNKRTALTVCGIFLARNNIVLNADLKDLENFTIQVATDHLGIDEIATWLKAHSD
ncbi:MAG TPA: type II toxin-antitoxin system death-on-curing family toxin [Verrucomicrobiae bacterium]|nr:type II toxin-antitoxin system death-on-curing family toxin [Verrucomicrobiae bacterium]